VCFSENKVIFDYTEGKPAPSITAKGSLLV
jgi:hypothetical protein